jgi:hypothetical protein
MTVLMRSRATALAARAFVREIGKGAEDGDEQVEDAGDSRQALG